MSTLWAVLDVVPAMAKLVEALGVAACVELGETRRLESLARGCEPVDAAICPRGCELTSVG